MATPKNKDRDRSHARRRGNEDPEDEVDGRDVARKLYGGLTDDEREPTSEADGTT